MAARDFPLSQSCRGHGAWLIGDCGDSNTVADRRTVLTVYGNPPVNRILTLELTDEKMLYERGTCVMTECEM